MRADFFGNVYNNPPGSPTFKITVMGSARYMLSRMLAPPLKLGKDLPQSHVVSKEEFLEGISQKGDKLTWLGHCSFLLELGGTRILTDPFLDGYAGSKFLRSYRRLSLPVGIEELPEADILLLSHEHADHCDIDSILRLPGRDRVQYIAPLGVGEKLADTGKVTELDWFEEATRNDLSITALPAIHYSTVPGNKTLWASFSIRSKDHTIFFAGDSGYGPVFKEDIAPYGPFDHALIGIGAYYLGKSWDKAGYVHMNPEQAVRAAGDINADNLIGMHWGTLRMTNEPPGEPPVRMQNSARKTGQQAMVLRIGETYML